MMQRRVMAARMTPLRERRQVRAVVSTESLGRDGLIVQTTGIDLTNFKRNPTVLWEHNPEQPIARCVDIRADGGDLIAVAQFPRPGVSPKADEVYGLVGEGVIGACSLGFDVKASEPLDREHPFDGQRITACEMIEYSFCSLPALADSLVLERALRRTRKPKHHSFEYHRAMARLYAMSAERYGREIAAERRRR